MTWQLPDTYHLAGHGRGTATFKFYEGRDILRCPCGSSVTILQGQVKQKHSVTHMAAGQS
jgi:hypothetical protein